MSLESYASRFQWAYLQIKQLLKLQLEREILERLGKLPEDLKATYDEIYNEIPEHEKQIADRAFQWVMCACRPLATKELLSAICQDENSDTILPVDLDEDIVLEYCHNLLVIDSVQHVWVPSHLSVIEYFEKQLSQDQANCLAATVCLLVLQNTVFYNRQNDWSLEENWSDEENDSTSRKEIEQNDPLYKQGFENLSLYARHHWMIHAKKSAGIGTKARISTLVDRFLGQPTNSSPAYQCWLRMTAKDRYSQRPPTSMFVSSGFHARTLFPDSISCFAYCAFDLTIILPDCRFQRKLSSPFLNVS
jgi:hypothetical protein